MNITKSSIMKGVLGVAMAGALSVAAMTPASARWGHGGAIAAGVIGGLALGAAVASQPYYGGGYGYYDSPAYAPYAYSYGPSYYGYGYGDSRGYYRGRVDTNAVGNW